MSGPRSIADVLGRLGYNPRLLRSPIPPPDEPVNARTVSVFMLGAALRAQRVLMDRDAFMRLAAHAFDVVADEGHTQGG